MRGGEERKGDRKGERKRIEVRESEIDRERKWKEREFEIER